MRVIKRKPKEQERRSSKAYSSGDKSYAYYKSQRHQPNVKPLEINESDIGKVRLLPSIFAGLVIIASILFTLTLSTRPTVEVAQDKPSPYRSIEEYKEYAGLLMSEGLSSHTKLSVNSIKIESEMVAKFPELNAAALRLPVIGRRPTLTIGIRQPAILLSNSSGLYILDENGRVVSLAKDVDSKYLSGLKNVRDESGIDVSLGGQAVTTGMVQFINEVNYQLTDKNLTIDKLTLPRSANELHLQLEGDNYFIKMDIAGNSRLQTGNFLAVREELTRQGVVPKEYIDVRVEEKAFYK